MSKSFSLAFAALAFAAVAAPALAHHSFAMFDRTRQVRLEGVVKEFQWTNPHVFIELDVAGARGGERYSIEGGSPNMLFRQGWGPTSFKPGDRVTVVMNPLKDGRRGGVFVWAKLADGKTLGNLGAIGGPG